MTYLAVAAVGPVDLSAQCVATRVMGTEYMAGTPLLVIIDVQTDASAVVWSIEETLPMGWRAVKINEAGVFAGGSVRWLSFSGLSTMLMYEAIPAADAAGTVVFDGFIGVDLDPLAPICGDTFVEPSCPPPCPDPLTPVVVSHFPPADYVSNNTNGITEIVVQFDRAVVEAALTIQGILTGEVTNGVLLGEGTDTHRLVFPVALPDRDRYHVTLRVGEILAQWEFVTLIGDCDRNHRVDIFDLGRIRTRLRDAAFDPDCDIQADGVINIFDLGHVRFALRDGAAAP